MPHALGKGAGGGGGGLQGPGMGKGVGLGRGVGLGVVNGTAGDVEGEDAALNHPTSGSSKRVRRDSPSNPTSPSHSTLRRGGSDADRGGYGCVGVGVGATYFLYAASRRQ